jgi:hypothetical protein
MPGRRWVGNIALRGELSGNIESDFAVDCEDAAAIGFKFTVDTFRLEALCVIVESAESAFELAGVTLVVDLLELCGTDPVVVRTIHEYAAVNLPASGRVALNEGLYELASCAGD